MKKRGFTFVELMIAVGISTGVMAVVFTFYIMVNKFYYAGANKSQLVSDIKNTMNLMVEELSRAEKIISVGNDHIEISMHTMKKPEGFGASLENVRYELVRKENSIYRIADNRKKLIFSATSVNVDEDSEIPLIRPYIKAYESHGYVYYKPEYNDSEKSERICYIEINLYGKLKNEELYLRSGVKLIFRYTHIQQPYWNFN